MKFQVLIECESHQEMGEVVEALGRIPVSLALSTTPSIPVSPNPSLIQYEDEEEELPLDPAAVFGSPNAAQIFAPNPNVGAMVAQSAQVLPATSAGSPTVADAELDPRGFPWDARIHSSAKTRLKGSDNWKYARGISQADIERVENELRAEGYGRTSTTQVQPVQQAPQTIVEAPMGLPGLPQLPVTQSGPTAESVKERFTRAIANRLVNAEWILKVLNSYGVANLDSLAVNPEKTALINDYLDQVKAHPGFENI